MLWTVQRRLIVNGLSGPKEQHEHEFAHTVDWTDYARFAPVPDKMLELRNLDKTTAHRYGIRWDTHNNSWITPIVSSMGALMGWQAKKQGWFRNHPEGVKRGTTLFGIERVEYSTGLLVESPLDVVRFHSVVPTGVSAVASFGASVTNDQINLLVDRFDHLILAMDNDETGQLATDRLRSLLPSFRRGLFFWRYPDTAKDIGDLSDQEIKHGINNVTMVPPTTGDRRGLRADG
jgi:hypothetical protein